MTLIKTARNKLTASLTLAVLLCVPVAGVAQTSTYHRHHYRSSAHSRAQAEQRASDHRHHTGAKIVVGSAAGGAVVGGLVGGVPGALVGGAAGAGGGAIANHIRVKHAVKKRERRESHEPY